MVHIESVSPRAIEHCAETNARNVWSYMDFASTKVLLKLLSTYHIDPFSFCIQPTMTGGTMVWAARVIPAVLLGIIGYVSWVVTHTIVRKLPDGRWSSTNLPASRMEITSQGTDTVLQTRSFLPPLPPGASEQRLGLLY